MLRWLTDRIIDVRHPFIYHKQLKTTRKYTSKQTKKATKNPIDTQFFLHAAWPYTPRLLLRVL
jgi:hypothetical protein